MARRNATADELSEIPRADFKRLLQTPAALNGRRAVGPAFLGESAGKPTLCREMLRLGERS